MDYITKKKYINTKFGDINTYIFTVKVKDILPIYYVAIRGRDDIDGAVQRVLNTRRISSIRDFILAGNMFFNTFILNWTDKNYKIVISDTEIKIPIVSNSAQVIDGQHRLEGLKKAYEENIEIGEKEIVVIMSTNLSTKDAAKIFLNINSEQKPVPKSLVYDLFGEIKNKDFNIVRANDIATEMHNDPKSPYYQCIKLPGSKQGKIDLSTVVNALKEYLDDSGTFSVYKFSDFESQYKIVSNFCLVIQYYYDKESAWLKSINPFMTNAGFYALMQFLCDDIIPKCVEKKSFEQKVMRDLIPLDDVGLLYREDIKNMQGKEQRKEVYKFLKDALLREIPNQDEYKF